MISKLLRALRVFLLSLLGRDEVTSLPEPTPVIPTLAERFGFPFPQPRLSIRSPLGLEECAERIRAALGRGTVEIDRAATREPSRADPVPLRIRLTGRYKMSGLLQRQLLGGEFVPAGSGTKLELRLAPRRDSSGPIQLMSTLVIASIVCFTFLTWLTGPTGVSLLAIGAISIVLGAIAGALAQGYLNLRGNLKERRRLTRSAARLATLLDGRVVDWP